MTNEIEKWEYKVQTLGSTVFGTKDEDLEETLNLLGIEGWEVIHVYIASGGGKTSIIAKRPLTRETIRKRSTPQFN
jgi:hypothetical protein